MDNLPPIGLQAIFDVSQVRQGVNEYNKLIRGANQSTASFGRTSNREVPKATANFSKLGGILTRTVATGAIAATAAIVGFAKSSISAAADLEAQLSGVQAVLNLDTAELQKANELVKNLGVDPNLTVRASEAAAAVEVLAKNGLSLDQILNGAAEASIILSNATGSDLSNAADIATDAMVIFNISAENMVDAVDSITGVVVNSKFDIDDYRLALSAAAGTAQASGVEFEDLNAALVALSPNFTSGRTAGTALANLLTRLEPTTKTATGAMKDLGLITAEGQNQFFNAAGELKDFGDIIDVLGGAFNGLTEQQRISYGTTIFGRDAYKAVAATLRTTGAEFEALSDRVNNQTDATDQAAIRVDNLKGEWERLLSIIEGLKTEIGEALTPILREMVIALKDSAAAAVEFVKSAQFQDTVKATSDGIRFLNGSLAEQANAQAAARVETANTREELVALVADLAKVDNQLQILDPNVTFGELFGDDLGGQTQAVLAQIAAVSNGVEEFRANVAAVEQATGEVLVNENATGLDDVARAYERLSSAARQAQADVRGDAQAAAMAAASERVAAAVEAEAKAQAELGKNINTLTTEQLKAVATSDQYTKAQKEAATELIRLRNSYNTVGDAQRQAEVTAANLARRYRELFTEQLKGLDTSYDLTDSIIAQFKEMDQGNDILAENLLQQGLITQTEFNAASARTELVLIQEELNAQYEAGTITQAEYVSTLSEETDARREVIDGVVLEQEALERAEEAQKQYEEAVKLAVQALDDLNGTLVGTFNSYEATGDPAAEFNETLYDSAVAAGGSITELAGLAAGLGIFTDEQIKAKLEAALFQVAIDDLSAQFSGGSISLSEYIDGARNVRDTLAENFTAVFEEQGIDGVIANAAVIEGDLTRITAAEYGVSINTTAATAATEVTNLSTQLTEVDGTQVNIKTAVDSKTTQTEVGKVKTAVEAVTQTPAGIKFEANTETVTENVTDMKEETIDPLTLEPLPIEFDDNAEEVSGNIDDTKRRAEQLEGEYPIVFDWEYNERIIELEDIQDRLDAMERTYVITLSVTDPNIPNNPPPIDPVAPSALGGIIRRPPGATSGRDTVTGLLSIGEGVLRPSATQRLGEQFINSMNQGASIQSALEAAGRLGSLGQQKVVDNSTAQTVTNIHETTEYKVEIVTSPNAGESEVDALYHDFNSVLKRI